MHIKLQLFLIYVLFLLFYFFLGSSISYISIPYYLLYLVCFSDLATVTPVDFLSKLIVLGSCVYNDSDEYCCIVLHSKLSLQSLYINITTAPILKFKILKDKL